MADPTWRQVVDWAEQGIADALKQLERSEVNGERQRGRIEALRSLIRLAEDPNADALARRIEPEFASRDIGPPAY